MELNNIENHDHASVSLKVIMLVFAVILVGVLGYFVYQQNTVVDTTDNSTVVKKSTSTTDTTTGTTTPTTTTDETADWKTYTGTYFSFKYPADWKLSTTGLGDANLLAQLISPATQKKLDAGEQCYEICQEKILFYYYDKVADERENKANNYGATTLDELVTRSTTFTKIGAIKINEIGGYDGVRGGLSSYYQVYLSKNNHLYEIFFNHRETKSKISSTEGLIINSYKALD